MSPPNSAHYIGVDQRVSPRTDIYARMPVTLPDGRSAMVTVVNISADGILMRHEHKLEEGSTVLLSLPVIGRVKARTVWSLGGRSGVNFFESIDMRDYIPLLRAFGAQVSA